MSNAERYGASVPEIDGRDYSELRPHFAQAPHEQLDVLRDRAAVVWDRAQQQFLSLEYGTTRKLLQDGAWLRDRKRVKAGTAVSQAFEAAPDFVSCNFLVPLPADLGSCRPKVSHTRR